MATYVTKDSGVDRAFTISNYIILFLFLIAVAYPIVYVISASFSSPEAVVSGQVWLWPVDFTLQGYEAVFKRV